MAEYDYSYEYSESLDSFYSIDIVLMSVRCFMVIVGLISNVTVMAVMCKIKEKTLTDVLVINLMVIDLLMCLKNVFEITAPFLDGWFFPLCNFSGVLNQLYDHSAGVTLCAVSIDRYLSISRSTSQSSKSMLVCRKVSIVWVSLLLLSVPYFFFYGSHSIWCFIFDRVVLLINTCIIIVITFILPLIITVVIQKKLSNNAEERRSLIINIYRVYIAYLVVFLPTFIQILLNLLIRYHFSDIFIYIVYSLYLLPSVINPFLFMWFSMNNCAEINELRKYGTLDRKREDNTLLGTSDAVEGYGTTKTQ